MACDTPKKAYRLPDTTLSFSKPSGHSGAIIPIPCKQCLGCILDRRSDWQIRGMHEKQFHQDAHFVTLTYSDENIPTSGDLNREDIQKFFKRIRKAQPDNPIRYMYAGEYGSTTDRPHFHAIIYGLELPDKKPATRNSRGEILYNSEFLEEKWQFGFSNAGEVTQQSIGYVAGYMLKDLTTARTNKKHFKKLDFQTGELIEAIKPFSGFSTKPAIGRTWFEKYYKDVFPDGYITIPKANNGTDPLSYMRQRGKKSMQRVPAYYVDLLAKIDPDLHSEYIEKRNHYAKSDKVFFDNTPERKEVKKTVRNARISLGKKSNFSEVGKYN